MNQEVKYFIDLEKVTIFALQNIFEELDDLDVPSSAEVRIKFGLEPGTYRVEVIDG